MAASQAPRSRTCNRTSRRATVVRHSSAQWAAHARPLRSHSLSAARDGGSHGLFPPRQRQPPSPSGSRSPIRGMPPSTLCRRLRRRNRRRRRRARAYRRHPPNPRPRRRQLQRRREGPVRRRLMPPLQPRHRSPPAMQCSRRQVRSTKPFRCGLPRRLLPPPNYETRPDDKERPRPNCRPGPRFRPSLVAPCGQRRRPTSPARSRPRHRRRPPSAGSPGGEEPFSGPQINRRGSVSIFL